jgi:hypothetical protein
MVGQRRDSNRAAYGYRTIYSYGTRRRDQGHRARDRYFSSGQEWSGSHQRPALAPNIMAQWNLRGLNSNAPISPSLRFLLALEPSGPAHRGLAGHRRPSTRQYSSNLSSFRNLASLSASEVVPVRYTPCVRRDESARVKLASGRLKARSNLIGGSDAAAFLFKRNRELYL